MPLPSTGGQVVSWKTSAPAAKKKHERADFGLANVAILEMVGVEAKEDLAIFQSEAGKLGVNLQNGEIRSLGIVMPIAIIIIMRIIIGIRRRQRLLSWLRLFP